MTFNLEENLVFLVWPTGLSTSHKLASAYLSLQPSLLFPSLKNSVAQIYGALSGPEPPDLLKKKKKDCNFDEDHIVNFYFYGFYFWYCV